MAKKLMKGCEAIAEAAIQAGCRYFFGYPITPQNDIPEYMSRRMPQVGGCFLQAESELAAINMVYGAGGAGARAMTSSSSPGISLKQEGISTCAAAEVPCVIVNMMRGGPGLGNIQASQGDYFQACKGGGHGDYRCVVFAPSSIQETCDLMPHAFDTADKYRTPVIILADGLIGQMMEPVELKMNDNPTMPEKPWACQGWDPKGDRPRAVINSLYIETETLDEVMTRLNARYDEIRKNEVMVEKFKTEGADFVLCAYGTVARVCKAAVRILAENGIKCGLVRPITLWPFPTQDVHDVITQETVQGALTVEISNGQMVEDVRLAVNGEKPVEFMGKGGSIIPSAEEIAERVMQIMRRA
ncbi:MAG: 3-methyl-2-oxobutanoate dehydrogenase subunit VorB [Oscillospiraceae bacterium]|jgi:Pyruvate:ferredoxin oxidoreductase and related 2-oxoacid:ferredoxin oxidoreductases, alpha subunit|nr:3-methyl-2-oxobutanoate dehydrogenase subunit VorB [Oscillospiraceae bacterium]